jgi:RNA polymerase sigma factor (sigma-70 family)
MTIDTKNVGNVRRKEAQVDSGPAPDLELREIVLRAAAGEGSAWEALTARFGGSIMAIARSCRLCEADAWEVQQTTWLRLVENIDRIQQPERIGSWLATTARRECLRLVRMSSRVNLDDAFLNRLADDSIAEADAGPIADERAALVRAAFEQLSPKCQKLLGFLSGDDGSSYKEISTVLSMPIGSIGPTRGRCLEHLKKVIQELEASAVTR